MGFGDFLRESVLRSDLLSASPTFRIRKQPVFETISGGIISMLILAVTYYFLFVQMSSMMNNLTITYSQGVDDNVHSTSAISSFPFAVSIQGVDLSITPRKFIIYLWQHSTLNYSGGSPVETISPVTLSQCNYSDWSHFGLAVQHQYNSFHFDQMLCIQEGQNISLAGFAGSEVYEYVRLDIHECNQTIDGNCDTQANIDAYMTSYLSANDYFKVKIFVMDTIVSPSNSAAITHVLEKNIFLAFSKTMGTVGHINIGQFTLLTDESLLPYSHFQKDTGTYIQLFASNAVSLSSTRFINLNVYRSTQMKQISRNLGKIDTILSYVGGLFSLLFTALSFFFGSYSQYKYELYVAETTLTSQGKPVKEEDLSFFTFITYVCYDWLDAFGFPPSFCPKLKHIHQIRQESCEQLDPRFILQRIKHVEDISKILVSEHQQMCLHLSEPYTVEQSKKMRGTLMYYDGLIKQMKKQQYCESQKSLFSAKVSAKNAVMNECLQNQSNCSLKKEQKKISVQQACQYEDSSTQEKNLLGIIGSLQSDNSEIAQKIKMKIGQNILEYIKLTRKFTTPVDDLQESNEYKYIEMKSPLQEESDLETIRFETVKSKPIVSQQISSEKSS